MNKGIGIALVVALGAWLMVKGKVVRTPTISRLPNGQIIVTPAAGQVKVLPYTGAAPVQPVPVTIPANAITNVLTGQIKVYNYNTGEMASTTAGNLPALIAGGWEIVTADNEDLIALRLSYNYGGANYIDSSRLPVSPEGE
jgi:hypothetical protein